MGKLKILPCRPCFDINDKDVTPIIYTLLFCWKITGNDMSYDIYPYELGENYITEEDWKEQLARGWQNTYHDREAMKKMIENPPTLKAAIKHFHKWLKEKDFRGDVVVVKICW